MKKWMVILPKDGLELYHTNVKAQMAKASTISVTILLKYGTTFDIISWVTQNQLGNNLKGNIFYFLATSVQGLDKVKQTPQRYDLTARDKFCLMRQSKVQV